MLTQSKQECASDDTETYLHGDMATAYELQSNGIEWNPIETLLIALRAVNNAWGGGGQLFLTCACTKSIDFLFIK